jgi:ABC-type polysaccharide/polyol phosphate transport system ATPase subunit
VGGVRCWHNFPESLKMTTQPLPASGRKKSIRLPWRARTAPIGPWAKSEPKITARSLTIDFPIYDAKSRSFAHSLMVKPVTTMTSRSAQVGGTIAMGERGAVVVRAIDGISFEIEKGSRVGLIGHNGAGKTTLLRALAGIYEPTAGHLDTFGRIMPLFNIMEGMLPDATGREFIRIRGSLLGLELDQIDALAEDAINFCELGSYVDMPVRTYSTGMLVRLAFALATSVTSEILLFDELIGAGDERFLTKARRRLQTFVEQSSILVVATHSRTVLDQWCNRALLLEHGKLVYDGGVNEVLREYDRYHATAR